MKVPSGLDSPVNIPGDRVLQARFNCDYANWADPNLAGLSVLSGCLLNLIFISALDLSVRE